MICEIHAIADHLPESLPAQVHHHRIGGGGGSTAPGAGQGSLSGLGKIVGLCLQSVHALLAAKEQASGGNGGKAHLMWVYCD